MLNYRRVPTPLKNHGVSSSVGMMTFHSQLFLVIFHSYVSLPEGTYPSEKWWLVSSSVGMMTFHCQLFLESRNPAMFQSPPTSLPYVNWRLPFEAPNASTQLLNVSHPRRVGSRGLFFRTSVGNDKKKTGRRGIIISGGVEQEKNDIIVILLVLNLTQGTFGNDPFHH